MATNKISKTVELIIQEYLKTSFASVSERRGYGFAQKSYSRWAARELISYLEKNPNTPPLLVIEEFRDKMDRYSCMNTESSYIFSVAYDMATNIIDLLL